MPTPDEILVTIRTSLRIVIAEKLSHRGLLEVTENNARQLVEELAPDFGHAAVALLDLPLAHVAPPALPPGKDKP